MDKIQVLDGNEKELIVYHKDKNMIYRLFTNCKGRTEVELDIARTNALIEEQNKQILSNLFYGGTF